MKSEQPTHLPAAQVDVLVQLRIAMCASVYHGAHLLRVLSFVFLPRAIGENRAPPCASPTNDRNKCGGRARGGTHVTRPERRLWFSAAASSPVILLFPMDPTSFSTQSTYFWGTEDEESLWTCFERLPLPKWHVASRQTCTRTRISAIAGGKFACIQRVQPREGR